MTHRATPKARARGFIVIAVLWILAALSGFVLIYLSYVTNSAVTVAGSTDRIQTEALVQGAVELAALQLAGREESARPGSGTFNARIGTSRVFVTFRSEAARVDLNAAPKPLLAGLMTALGASAANAAAYADRIIAWRTPADRGEADPENSYYRVSGATYLPRHAPFPSTEELWLVLGIPPAIVERMMPFVTVFSNSMKINVIEAEPQVLAALPNATPEALQAALAQRGDPRIEPRSLISLLGGEGAALSGSDAYRIAVETELSDGRRRTAEVVIMLLESKEEPYRILSWRNASDGSMTARGGGSK